MSSFRFLIIFSLLLLFAGTAAYIIENADPATNILIPKFWVVFGFLAVLTALAYVVALVGFKKGPEISVYVVMAAITIKLILSMLLVLVYLQIYKVNSVVFVAQFFSLYFLFTAFEVYALLLNLRHQNKN